MEGGGGREGLHGPLEGAGLAKLRFLQVAFGSNFSCCAVLCSRLSLFYLTTDELTCSCVILRIQGGSGQRSGHWPANVHVWLIHSPVIVSFWPAWAYLRNAQNKSDCFPGCQARKRERDARLSHPEARFLCVVCLFQFDFFWGGDDDYFRQRVS